jgi:NAD(P)-dependent dehydrogenase (short-subunit alcohol dehydrogenase family)
MTRNSRTVLITGSSSGIGRATVDSFLDAGWNVAATMRSPSPDYFPIDGRCIVPRLDVCDRASIDSAMEEAVTHFGRIDAIVNNAGYGLSGPLESFTEEQITRQIETNVLGTMRVITSALPHLRRSPRGAVINVSSVSGRITIPFYSLYHASKWAIEGFSESLSYELRPFGIRVRIIEPGPIQSEFYGRSLDRGERMPEYAALEDRAERVMNVVKWSSGSVDRVASVIVRSAESRSWRLRYGVHTFGLPLLRKVLPERLIRELTFRLMLGRVKALQCASSEQSS